MPTSVQMILDREASIAPDRLLETRTTAGLTHAAMGELNHVTPQCYGLWERGQSRPTGIRRVRLIDVVSQLNGASHDAA